MWPGVGIPPRAVGLERFPQGFLQGVIFSPAGLVSQGERLAVQKLSDFIRNQRLQILQVVSPHQVQGISGIDQFQVPHRHLVSRRIRPQSRIALTQAASTVSLPWPMSVAPQNAVTPPPRSSLSWTPECGMEFQ